MNWRKVLARKKDTQKRVYEISGSEWDLDHLEQLFTTINECNKGMSRKLILEYDGDGSAFLEIKRQDKNELAQLDKKDREQLYDGKDFQVHIGE